MQIGDTVRHFRHGLAVIVGRSAHDGWTYSRDGWTYTIRLANGDRLISWPGEFVAVAEPKSRPDGQAGLWGSTYMDALEEPTDDTP